MNHVGDVLEHMGNEGKGVDSLLIKPTERHESYYLEGEKHLLHEQLLKTVRSSIGSGCAVIDNRS